MRAATIGCHGLDSAHGNVIDHAFLCFQPPPPPPPPPPPAQSMTMNRIQFNEVCTRGGSPPLFGTRLSDLVTCLFTSSYDRTHTVSRRECKELPMMRIPSVIPSATALANSTRVYLGKSTVFSSPSRHLSHAAVTSLSQARAIFPTDGPLGEVMIKLSDHRFAFVFAISQSSLIRR